MYVYIDIPPVPLGQSALVDALTIQLAVGSDAATSVPTLSPDVFEHTSGSVPSIEMDVDRYICRNQLATAFQNLSRQAIFADKTQPSPWLTFLAKRIQGRMKQADWTLT